MTEVDHKPGEFNEAILDKPDTLLAADPSGVLRALASAGAQVRRACELTEESGVLRLSRDDRPRAVVVVARGGSAVVADALAALVGSAGPVPVTTCIGGVLPAWVGACDLVVTISLSGYADRPVAAATEAGRRGASLISIGAVGSLLAATTEQSRGLHIALPEPGREATSAPNTRTALWSMLTPALLALGALGLVQASVSDLHHVADLLDLEAESCRPTSESFVNPAKSLALELAGTVPVVLGTDPVGAVAARRAASVLCRTARIPALHGGLPDDAGDIVATFGGPLANAPDDIFADPDEHSTRLRLLLLGQEEGPAAAALRTIASDTGVRSSELLADAETDLGRLAQLVARVDFAAAYLALACGYDPAISPQVADLRDALR